MAIHYASRGRDTNPAINVDRAGQVAAVASVYDLASGVPAASDTIRFMAIPEGYRVIGATLDAGAAGVTAGVIDVGLEDGAADSIFDGQSTASTSVVTADKGGLTNLVVTDGDSWVTATVGTAPTGTGTLTLVVYVVPEIV